MALQIYDPKDVHIIFGGVGPVSGFADGSFVTVESSADAFTRFVGVDGEIARSLNNNQSGMISVSLMQSSPVNARLSLVHKADLEAHAGIFPMIIYDVNGAEIYQADRAWIARDPDVEYDRRALARTWRFETDRLRRFGFSFV